MCVNMNEAQTFSGEVPKPTAVETVQQAPPPAFEAPDSKAEIPHHIDAGVTPDQIASATARIAAARETLLADPQDRENMIKHLQAKIEEKKAAGLSAGAYERSLAKLMGTAPVAANENKNMTENVAPPGNSLEDLQNSRSQLEQRAAQLMNGVFSPMVDGELSWGSKLVAGAESRVRQAKVGESAGTPVQVREAELQQALGKYTEVLKAYIAKREASGTGARSAEAVAAQEKAVNASRVEAATPRSARLTELMSKDPFDVTIEYMTALKSMGGAVPSQLEMLKADVESGKRMGLSEKDMQPRYAAFLEAADSSGDKKLAA